MLNVLVAYPYFDDKILSLLRSRDHSDLRIIVDSGAFTAWNTDRTIDLDSYCRFLDSISCLRPFHAVQLDVVGDPDASWKNYLKMRERGYDVMPVFTRGEFLDRLDLMYQHTDYVMFGGLVGGRKNKNYVKWFLEKNAGRKGHWLGFVNMDFIKCFRPESVDSSSWMSAARYGNVSFYDGGGNLTLMKRSSFVTRPPAKIFQIFESYGLDPHLLQALAFNRSWIIGKASDVQSLSFDVRSGSRGSAHMVNTLAHVARALDTERSVGTKIYLATASSLYLKSLFVCYDALIEGSIYGKSLKHQRSEN